MRHPMILAPASSTLIAAIVSAVYWFKSAAVPTPEFEQPTVSVSDAPGQHIITAAANAAMLHAAMIESARLNRRAAIWTGISALPGAVTTVSGVLG